MDVKWIKKLPLMPLFRDVSEGEVLNMLGCLACYTKSFKKGEYIFLTEEKLPSIGMVLSGTVQLLQEDIWGNRTILTNAKVGELFGESFVCAGAEKVNVLFYAQSDAEILFLPFERVITTCSNSCVHHHKIVQNMMFMVAEKNLKLMEKLEVTSKKSLREKILTYLSLLAQKSDSKFIESPMGRVELAEYLCADRSALTRELSAMKSDGLIDYDKNTFRLL